MILKSIPNDIVARIMIEKAAVLYNQLFYCSHYYFTY